MTDVALDRAIEIANENEWEAQNPPEPSQPIKSLSNDVRISAYAIINTGRFMMGIGLEYIGEGLELVKNTPQGDKLAGLYDQLSDLIHDLKEVEREVWGCKNNA